MNEYSHYLATQTANRVVFQKNFANNYATFNSLFERLRSAWERIGIQRGITGESHAGLLYFANLLIRHTLIGFQQITTYQSFLAWLTFRPGLEAFLMIGKLVDDSSSANVWKGHRVDWKLYNKTFTGAGLESKSLPRSKEFRRVLSCLNDDFMHPNPTFTYRDSTSSNIGNDVFFETQLFDVDGVLHESHLLAYLNLLDLITESSCGLIDTLCGPSPSHNSHQVFAQRESSRALAVAAQSVASKSVLNDLGLWGLP